MMDYNTLKAYIDGLYADNVLSTEDYNKIILYILANGDLENSPRDLMQIRRGNVVNLPTLAQGELALTLDEEKAYVGGMNGNIEFAMRKTVDTLLAEYGVSVKLYGAKGDGIADDSSAIQNAINANSGKKIIIPAGNYLVSVGILLNTSYTELHFIGDSKITYSGVGSALTITGNKSKVFNPTIINAAGNKQTFTGIKIKDVSRCFVQSPSLFGASVGMLLEGAASGVYYCKIEHINTFECVTGIKLLSSGMPVNSNNFSISQMQGAIADTGGEWGIVIDGGSANNFFGGDIDRYTLGGVYFKNGNKNNLTGIYLEHVTSSFKSDTGINYLNDCLFNDPVEVAANSDIVVKPENANLSYVYRKKLGSENLKCCLDFNKGSGAIVQDISNNNKFALYNNSVARVVGDFGMGVSMVNDGTISRYLSLPVDTLDLTQDFTIALHLGIRGISPVALQHRFLWFTDATNRIEFNYDGINANYVLAKFLDGADVNRVTIDTGKKGKVFNWFIVRYTASTKTWLSWNPGFTPFTFVKDHQIVTPTQFHIGSSDNNRGMNPGIVDGFMCWQRALTYSEMNDISNLRQSYTPELTNRVEVYGSTAPVTGTWAKGDICWNTDVAGTGVMGWVCTVAPNTWKSWGAITP